MDGMDIEEERAAFERHMEASERWLEAYGRLYGEKRWERQFARENAANNKKGDTSQ
ncbi:MAG: hypothetical protein LBL96_07605 [Clostridiales bacterium]|jgi:hypothetical protein|nr:hypothetical protein [Clostridiales bacterium]